VAFARRPLLGLALAGLAVGRPRAAAATTTVRLGVLQFGTVQWLAETIRRRGLDAARGFTLAQVKLANTEAGRVALMAGAADLVVSDWLFVAMQRAHGTKLSFVPLTAATGAVMTRKDILVHQLRDLKDRRLGVAGGPVDKSWILVQAAGRQQGIDLTSAANVIFGAPPLLEAKLLQGELDAVLTYWNFAARLEAAGARQAILVSDCVQALGLPARLGLVGFVFRSKWAEANRQALEGFLAASAAAEDLLATSDPDWAAIRPLTGAADDPALLAGLRTRFAEGRLSPADRAETERSAPLLLAILATIGGNQATGGLASLPEGVFWHERNGA
jgi:NitT/TauT family transport system substrate-binding protein